MLERTDLKRKNPRMAAVTVTLVAASVAAMITHVATANSITSHHIMVSVSSLNRTLRTCSTSIWTPPIVREPTLKAWPVDTGSRNRILCCRKRQQSILFPEPVWTGLQRGIVWQNATRTARYMLIYDSLIVKTCTHELWLFVSENFLVVDRTK